MDRNYIEGLRPMVISAKRTLENSRLPDDRKALLVLMILLRHWEDGRKLTQADIARLIPDCGHHKLWELRTGAKQDTTVRKVREVVEKVLRKRLCLPVLSTPGKGSTKAGSAGYWLARSRTEAREYVERRRKEIDSAHRSSIDTLLAVTEALMLED